MKLRARCEKHDKDLKLEVGPVYAKLDGDNLTWTISSMDLSCPKASWSRQCERSWVIESK